MTTRTIFSAASILVAFAASLYFLFTVSVPLAHAEWFCDEWGCYEYDPYFYGDPGYVDPGYVDPGYVDPGYVDPGYVDPGYVDPGYIDPGYYCDPWVGCFDPCAYDPAACGYVDPGAPVDPAPAPAPVTTSGGAPAPVDTSTMTQEEIDAYNAQVDAYNAQVAANNAAVAAEAASWLSIATAEAMAGTGDVFIDDGWGGGVLTAIVAPTVSHDENGNIIAIQCGNGTLFTFEYQQMAGRLAYTPPAPIDPCVASPALCAPPPPAADCVSDPALAGCSPPPVCMPDASCSAGTCGGDICFDSCGNGYWGAVDCSDPCIDDPSACVFVPPVDPCVANPALCTSAPVVTPAPPPSLQINTDRLSIRTGETVVVSWDTNSTSNLQCLIFGPDMGPIPFNPSLDGETGSRQSSPIASKSEFTILCTDPVNGARYTDTVVVEVAGTVQEI